MFHKKKLFLKISQYSQENTCWTLFNKVAVPEACSSIKKRLQHRCFPVYIAKFLRTAILKNIYERLLLTSLFIMVFHTKHFNLGGSKIDIFNNNSFQVIKYSYVIVFIKDFIVSGKIKLYL